MRNKSLIFITTVFILAFILSGIKCSEKNEHSLALKMLPEEFKLTTELNVDGELLKSVLTNESTVSMILYCFKDFSGTLLTEQFANCKNNKTLGLHFVLYDKNNNVLNPNFNISRTKLPSRDSLIKIMNKDIDSLSSEMINSTPDDYFLNESNYDQPDSIRARMYVDSLLRKNVIESKITLNPGEKIQKVQNVDWEAYDLKPGRYRLKEIFIVSDELWKYISPLTKSDSIKTFIGCIESNLVELIVKQ